MGKRRTTGPGMIGAAFAVLGACLPSGCEDSTGPASNARLTLSVVIPPNGPMTVSVGKGAAPSRFPQDDGTHSLVLDRVAVVVREVELKRISDDDCDALVGSEHDACEAFDIGPILLEVPLDGSVAEIMASDVPPDTYDELEFDIHKPEDDSTEDIQFLQRHPDFKGVSIRVEGTFDGEGFVFLQDLNEERELVLFPPLVVEKGSSTVNLTLELDIGSWFLDPSVSLVDPRTANKGGDNEDLVEENIKKSIRAFSDTDRDGREG